MLAITPYHGNDGYQVITELIWYAIIGFSVVGVACGVWAFWKLNREKAEWKKIQLLAPHDVLSPKSFGLLEKALFPRGIDGDESSHIVFRRLKALSEMLLNSDKSKHIQAPQISDLRQLSEQALLGNLAPLGLRIITSIMLILGICGTLWGVHGVVPMFDESSRNLSAFAPALNPSQLAVLITIVFFVARGIYAAMLDRFLMQLDHETMTLVFPHSKLVSKGQDGPVIGVFSETVSEFTDKLNANSDEVKRTEKNVKNNISAINKATSTFNSKISDLCSALADISAQYPDISEGSSADTEIPSTKQA